jgi:hypothetical protein
VAHLPHVIIIPMQFHKNYLNGLLAVLSVAFILIAYSRGMKADVNGDYYIYWQTGRNFWGGQKLYTPGLIDGGFTYPPFAALFFSVFAFLPFHWSAFVYTYVVNYGLWVGSLVLVYRLFKYWFPVADFKWPLVWAAGLSAGFYWHNFIWMNANLPVLCLTLLGIACYVRRQFTLSYLLLLAGTFFKITPVLFLAFAALKRGHKDWPKIILLALPFVIIPALVRGLPMGINDWKDYYEAFVAPFSKGRIDENIISLGMPTLLNKMNTGNAAVGIAPVLHLSAGPLKLMITLFQVLSLGALIVKIAYDRYAKGREEFTPADISLIFLATLLLPGRVWAHHHVCTSFIFTYVFLLLRHQKKTGLLIVMAIACLLTNLITKDVIGQTLTNYLKHYSFATLLMLVIGGLIVSYKAPNLSKA